MKLFLVHLSVTIIGAILFHEWTPWQFSGIAEFCIYALFMVILWGTSFFYNTRYFNQFWRSVVLFVYFSKQLLVANFNVIRFVMAPGKKFTPAILELSLDVETEAGIVLLANMITLTPGTLTLRVSDDRKKLYFHTVNVVDGDPDKTKQQIKNGLEKHIMAIVQ